MLFLRLTILLFMCLDLVYIIKMNDHAYQKDRLNREFLKTRRYVYLSHCM